MAEPNPTTAPLYFAENDWDDGPDASAVDRAERAFLGACLLMPYLLDEGASLRPTDFRSAARGVVFDTMRSFPRRAFDVHLLLVALERHRDTAPPNGWACALGSLFDHACAFEDLIPSYVMTISEASALRRLVGAR